MIELSVVVLKEGEIGGGYFTEEASKSLVERGNKRIEEEGLPIFIAGREIIGKVKALSHDTENKCVVARIELNFDFDTQGKVLQDIQTSEGRRVIDCDIVGINLVIGEKKK